MRISSGEWIKKGLSVVSWDTGVVCTAPTPGNGGCFDLQDNLALIAAAPALLSAMKRFLAYWESDFIKVTANDGRTLAEQMRLMRSAVTKAEKGANNSGDE